MTTYNRGEAGKRAAREIREVTWSADILLKDELEHLGVSGCMFWSWDHGRTDPSAQSLWTMAKCGYDVLYIVTGVRG